MFYKEYFRPLRLRRSNQTNLELSPIWKLLLKPANYMYKRKCHEKDLQSTWHAVEDGFLKLSTKSFVPGNTKHMI